MDKCKTCGGTGTIVVEEYTMSTDACPDCTPEEELNKPHPGDALEYPPFCTRRLR